MDPDRFFWVPVLLSINREDIQAGIRLCRTTVCFRKTVPPATVVLRGIDSSYTLKDLFSWNHMYKTWLIYPPQNVFFRLAAFSEASKLQTAQDSFTYKQFKAYANPIKVLRGAVQKNYILSGHFCHSRYMNEQKFPKGARKNRWHIRKRVRAICFYYYAECSETQKLCKDTWKEKIIPTIMT